MIKAYLKIFDLKTIKKYVTEDVTIQIKSEVQVIKESL